LKGIYVLIIDVNKDINVNIGSKGKVAFKKGLYAYVGSAQANLEQRVRRHLRKQKRLFWHIDYLVNSETAKIIKVFQKEADKTEECVVAEMLDAEGNAVEGFGCSDCNCKTHLFHIKNYKFLQEGMQEFSIET
jgi:Uri superfamily endonuclease